LGPLGLALATGGGPRRTPGRAGVHAIEGQDDLGPFSGAELRWDGPELPVRTTVRADPTRPLLVFRIEASRSLTGLASGRFEEPAVAFPFARPAARRPGGVPEGTRAYGHQHSEFAFPTMADAELRGFLWVPHRPAVLMPLLFVAPDGRTVLLGPLQHFHEQGIAVPRDEDELADGLRAGWHGDLDRVPAGFATELALLAASGPRAALEQWGELLRARHGTVRPGRYADPLLARLSYWTDNGGVYYYRTAPGCDYATTLERVVEDLDARGIPVHAVHVDSWFYPHETLRLVSEQGAPVVPPTGMLRWEPREDVFPDGMDGLSQRLGRRPLSLHARHFAARSPYFEEYPAWVDGGQAHPEDPSLYRLLVERAARWGACTYEQDWMSDSFHGVRGVREAPERASAWQHVLDEAAADREMSLLWCMATPPDFLETTRLRRVGAIRTSGDYQYLYDNALNWVWFLHTNAFARALGLWPFKDVFVSHDKTPEGFGEPLAEAESLLAALSAGPVGLGDQIGHARREIVMRTCREDGVLVKPDRPLAAIDRCFTRHAYVSEEPLVAETHSRHPAGTWVYAVVMNACHATKEPARELAWRLPLRDLGEVAPRGPVVALDWRSGRTALLGPDDVLEGRLAYQDFAYHVLCPLLSGRLAVLGDVVRYATVGDRRVAGIGEVEEGVRFEVHGVPGSAVDVHLWAEDAPRTLRAFAPCDAVGLALEPGPEGRRHVARVRLGPSGFARVTVER
ncbi:MAG: hypothetical protein R3263_05905, partial [Myxococcota bacterium]|nr:hypothetical protein [Myxococcota bacterium]